MFVVNSTNATLYESINVSVFKVPEIYFWVQYHCCSAGPGSNNLGLKELFATFSVNTKSILISHCSYVQITAP